MSNDMLCDAMKNNKNLCDIYAKMRYQDIFTEQYLIHLYDYQHPDTTDCKYGDECYAYKRLEAGGNELSDRCHIAIFKHPPRGRRGFGGRQNGLQEGINSFCLNDEW
eukprot:800036_1